MNDIPDMQRDVNSIDFQQLYSPSFKLYLLFCSRVLQSHFLPVLPTQNSNLLAGYTLCFKPCFVLTLVSGINHHGWLPILNKANKLWFTTLWLGSHTVQNQHGQELLLIIVQKLPPKSALEREKVQHKKEQKPSIMYYCSN